MNKELEFKSLSGNPFAHNESTENFPKHAKPHNGNPYSKQISVINPTHRLDFN